jgi:hypothetical protein
MEEAIGQDDHRSGGRRLRARLGRDAEAATAPAEQAVLPPAQSYAELLDPIPIAPKLLRADKLNADNLNKESGAASDEKPVQLARYYYFSSSPSLLSPPPPPPPSINHHHYNYY